MLYQNWFQNRRAREKKERNIREYEAKQRLEREVGDVEERYSDIHRGNSELVASSAPFPEPRSLPRTLTKEDSLSSLTTDTDSEGVIASPLNSSSQSSPHSTGVHRSNSGAGFELPCLDMAATTPISPDMDVLANVPNAGYFSSQHHSIKSEQLRSLLSPDHAHENGMGYHFSGHAASLSHDEQPRSLGSDNIAFRRNKRPPPLAIDNSRSFPSIPKTAAELNRRPDYGMSMRRVTSTGYPGRVSKSISTPKSPFFDRRADGLFHLNRSPSATGAGLGLAPPTPDTPLVAIHSSDGDVSLAPHFHLDDKFGSPGVALKDPTMRTPPTSPGILNHILTIDSAARMPLGDDGLITPGIGRYPGEFEVPSLPTAIPSYLGGNMRGNASVDNHNMHLGQGPMYFGFSGGNAGYNWSDASTSDHSSPEHSAQDNGYMNMATSRFRC